MGGGMYGSLALGPMIIGGAFMLISMLVGRMLKKKFAKYSKLNLQNGMSGKEIAEQMLAQSGISDVKVIQVRGQLTDHYNPRNKTVNLSEVVYNMRNASSAAVAAHEVGHAIQHAKGYKPLQFRSKMVPIQNISSKMMSILAVSYTHLTLPTTPYV